MEKIKPSFDTTKEELQSRIDYMMSEKTRIEELSKVDIKQAIADFRALRRFADDEWHELTANFPGFYNSMSKKPTITVFFEV